MASCLKKTRRFLSIVKALISRGLFVLHGLICIWRVTVIKRNVIFWSLSGTLPFMVIESFYTLCKKKGGEWKWICPSVVLYLATAIPAIWFLELDLMRQRLMIGVMRHPPPPSSSNDTGEVFSLNGKMIHIPISLGSEEWCKILEQMLLLILIIGRWLLPKGEITREQLSQLLLVYIGMAADIIELFEAFKEKTVRENSHLTIVILSLWTASLTQFSLVVTATKSKSRRPALESLDSGNECCPTEMISILISVFLQDAPFLVLRMLLIFRYDVVSYTNIFFTCKNTLVLVLQIYRLLVLFGSSPPDPSGQQTSTVTRSHSSSDTLRDLYGSSGSLSGSSTSGRSSPVERRPHKERNRRKRVPRQLTADSAKTVSSSMDGADTTHSLDTESGTSKHRINKQEKRTPPVSKATKLDGYRNKGKSPEKKIKKEEWKEDRKRDQDGKKVVKSEKTDKRSKDGQVKRKVKRFERQTEVPSSLQHSSDSELTDHAMTEDPVLESRERKLAVKGKSKPAMHSNHQSPKTDHHRRRYQDHLDMEERQEGHRHGKQQHQQHQQGWESVKDLRTALAFLNEAGRVKTVVVKSGDEGDTMYVIDSDDPANA